MKFINPFQKFMGVRLCDGADFDGINDYMTRGAALTGVADSKSGIFHAMIRLDGGTVAQCILGRTVTSGTRFFVGGTSPNKRIYYYGFNSASAVIMFLESSTTYSVGSWISMLCSWDLATSTAHLYINDVSDVVGTPTITNDTIDYTQPDWGVGAVAAGTSKYDGCIAELYFAPGQYLDLSVEANRRKFITADIKPVPLGSDGSAPTGVAPAVYLHLDDGEAVAGFATNRGTGGNFTITGTLDTASTSPSD